MENAWVQQQDAQRVIEIYRKRWVIEEYHKAVKSGFQLEANQMKYAGRILALLGMIGVLATQLLAIREKCRLDPISEVEKVIPEIWQKLVEDRMRNRGLKIAIKTTRDFWRYVAQMGGFLERKSDGEPGWQTVWKGFMKLQDMLLGVSVLEQLVGKA